MGLKLGRDVCNNLEAAENREWIVTNGIGGYASGTVAGSLTRRYHGYLFSALKPPLGRTLMLTKLDETAYYGDKIIQLSTNRWNNGHTDPTGYSLIENFELRGKTPVWTYTFGNTVLEKMIWMKQGSNTTYIFYNIRYSDVPVKLEIKALINYRDYHGSTHAGGWQMRLDHEENGVVVYPYDGAVPFYLMSQNAEISLTHDWYYNYYLSREEYRGLEHNEDHLHVATFSIDLTQGQVCTMVATTDKNVCLDGPAELAIKQKYEKKLIRLFKKANPAINNTDKYLEQLILASDQFIADRKSDNTGNGKTVIAGYHWFGDWGRDTMISLPGLTLTTGRPEIARDILTTFGRYVDMGMLPNRFPDGGENPEYNTVDAALWYFESVRAYYDLTKDTTLLTELYPLLADIIDWHTKGTRYNIHMDNSDGLLYAGENSVQLTWMDAKVGDWVVTPRIGKPVEVNALWYNAIHTMIYFSKILNKKSDFFGKIADLTQHGFKRFWNDDKKHCHDVLDTPDGNDMTLRPNQIFTVSLKHSPFTKSQQKSIVDVCKNYLLTPFGLKSLVSENPNYRPTYGGDQYSRDSAYHQGTVWAWLLGHFIIAHARISGNTMKSVEYIKPVFKHLCTDGLGTISEIFDAEPPHSGRGCIAQAWSVAEILRAYVETINKSVK